MQNYSVTMTLKVKSNSPDQARATVKNICFELGTINSLFDQFVAVTVEEAEQNEQK